MKSTTLALAGCYAGFFIGLGSGVVHAQVLYTPPISSYDHVDKNNVNDPGKTTTNADGSTTTTYSDGWTKTTSPDASYGANGQKDVIKDGDGHLRETIKRDPAGKKRHHTLVIIDYPKKGTTTIYYEDYNAAGGLIGSSKEDITGDDHKTSQWDKEKQAWDDWVLKNAPLKSEKKE